MYMLRILSVCGLLLLVYLSINFSSLKQETPLVMAERKSIAYTFENGDEYQKHNGTVTTIIKEDTGAESWRMNRMLPPTAHPPPLTLGAIDKLKAIDGVVVEIMKDQAAEGS